MALAATPAIPAATATATATTRAAGLGPGADAAGLAGLRQTAGKDPKAAAQEAAKAFESLFMNELLKSMRAATESAGLMDNAGTRLGTELLDAQLAAKMVGRPGGLSDVIARQLERQMGLAPGPVPKASVAAAGQPAGLDNPATPRIPDQRAASFLQQHRAAADAAAAASGIPAPFMLAQAALETGWGKREITAPDGTPSHNLFGIKAGAGWSGPTVDVTTTEYLAGRPQKMVQRFRAYASEAESFADYARLMTTSPRYAAVTAAVSAAGNDAKAFAKGLQSAGYATDPAYADKLGKVIDSTLRLQGRGA